MVERGVRCDGRVRSEAGGGSECEGGRRVMGEDGKRV